MLLQNQNCKYSWQDAYQGMHKVLLFSKILASDFMRSLFGYFRPTSLGHPSTTKTSRENPSVVENA